MFFALFILIALMVRVRKKIREFEAVELGAHGDSARQKETSLRYQRVGEVKTDGESITSVTSGEEPEAGEKE